MTPVQLVLAVLVLGGAGFVIHRNLWRAIVFFQPTSRQYLDDAPPDQMRLPLELAPTGEALVALGFVPLGSRLEKLPLGPSSLVFDYGHQAETTFARLQASDSGEARVEFLTQTIGKSGEGFVITANYRRPGRELAARYLSGGLEGAPLERVFKAHLKRLMSFERVGPISIAERSQAEARWAAGVGKSEIRHQHVMGLLWTVGSVGMVIAAFFGTQ